MGFNANKAAQTIAYLCLKNGGRPINVLRAVKLVYIADRESIRQRGYPIQTDRYVSMPHGPVNSMTLSYIDGFYDDSNSAWTSFLTDRQNHDIGLARETIRIEDLDELSAADRRCLDEVWDRFSHMSQFQIRDWTHDRNNVPEWEDPNGSSKEIPLSKIMAAVGVPNPEEQAAIVNDMSVVDDIFARL